MEKYSSKWRDLISRVRAVFSGKVAISQSTNWYLEWGPISAQAGSFWDACDVIEMNCYPNGDKTQSVDQKLSTLVEGFIRKWGPAAQSHRSRYPGKTLLFGEIGTQYVNGAAQTRAGLSPARIDIQEYVDIWASYLIGIQVLRVDGLGAWVVRIASPWKQEPGWNESP